MNNVFITRLVKGDVLLGSILLERKLQRKCFLWEVDDLSLRQAEESGWCLQFLKSHAFELGLLLFN